MFRRDHRSRFYAIVFRSSHRRYDFTRRGRADGVPDFDHTAFNYHTMRPVDNGLWKEPDAAAGYAWFLYMTYVKTGGAKYLEAAVIVVIAPAVGKVSYDERKMRINGVIVDYNHGRRAGDR